MTTYKYILLTIIALACSTIANAQELKVVSFERINDISATSQPRTDASGNKCALIKVSLPVEGCKFSGSIIGNPVFETNEYWVYMTGSSKSLEIRCPGCKALVADFGEDGVESATTYRLRLSGYSNSASNNPSNTNINGLTGAINGHEYVDLGLPSGLKWATCNVGAFSPEDYGNYYAWGEIVTKGQYKEGNCETNNQKIDDISGNPQYDIAHLKWKGSWRMPTREELQELEYQCNWKWVTNKKDWRKGGYIVTGPNGKSIYLPAAGWRDWADLISTGKGGGYWSSSPDGNTESYYLYFRNDYIDGIKTNTRGIGYTIRPVSD